MSYQITVSVGMDGVAEVTSATTGTCAPPPGVYTISGHVPTSDAPTGSVGVSTPSGGVHGYAISSGTATV